MTENLFLVIAAFFTSFLSAIIGMGGGITLLGIMAIIMPDGFLVVAYHGIIQFVSNITRTYVFRNDIEEKIFSRYSKGLFFGLFSSVAVIVALINFFQVGSGSDFKVDILKPLIGVYIIWFLYLRKKNKPIVKNAFQVMGFFSGLVTVFVGAAGPLIAPLFLAEKISKETIIGTKAACQALGHFLKIPIFYYFFNVTYLSDWRVLLPLISAVYIGTNFGKSMLGKIPEKIFKTIFKLVLTLIAIRLLMSVFLINF